MKKRYKKPLSIDALSKLTDKDIDFSDIPETDQSFWKNAKLVAPDKTTSVTLRVKKSVLDAYKAKGQGYQTRMNTVLETYAKAKLSENNRHKG
mgnify:CR=1 FL=1